MTDIPHIHVWMFAYNGQKTLRRAIDSVLAQTYKNFTLYVLDNGSSDNTREMIKKYAAKDKRIAPFYNDKNMIFTEETKAFIEMPIRIPDEDLFCMCDCDDECYPKFFENALAFMKENDLDIVCGSIDFIEQETGRKVGDRKVKESLVLDESKYSQHFPLIYQFFRTRWAKLISARCTRNFASERIFDGSDPSKPDEYGLDTWDMLSALESARRIGFLKDVYYKWYISTTSSSYRMTPMRLASDRMLFVRAKNYLLRIGGLTSTNTEFITLVYLHALNDSLKLIFNAKLLQDEIIDGLREMFLNASARQLILYEFRNNTKVYNDLRNYIILTAVAWLLSREEVADEQVEGYCELGEFLSAAAENSGGWIFFKKLLARFLVDQGRLDEAKPKLDELAELLPEDMEVAELRAAARA